MLKSIHGCLTGLATLLLATLFSCSTPETVPDRSAALDTYLRAQDSLYRFNGNVLVAENGKIIFQKSYGVADFNTNRPLNDTTVFELASVSKQFTATAVLQLADQGKLKLTDTLRQYFPELPYYGVTLHHLLVHTSGLPDYESAMSEKWNHRKIAFNADMIAFLAKDRTPPDFAPGTRWEYSNTGYAVLASIVEKVSGQPFPAYLKEHIFQPLGMTRTRIYNTRRSLKDSIPDYAYGFMYNDSTGKYRMPDSIPGMDFVYYLDGIYGDGTVNSTTGDLLKWDRAIKNHVLLKETTLKEMLKEQAIVDTPRKAYYGYGLFMENTDLGYNIAHSGGWPGYITYLSRNLDKDQTFIVLSNNSSPSPAIATALQYILNGKEISLPVAHKAITADTGSLKPFIGTYKEKKGSFRIEYKDGKLYRVTTTGQRAALRPESATAFFFEDGTDRQIQFELDDSKKPVKAGLILYGVKTEYIKVK